MYLELTDQEIFEKVVTHFFTQGKPSVHEGACLYRGPNGLKCAVGILIPDELYDPIIEGCPVDMLKEGGFDEEGYSMITNYLSKISHCTLLLLADLQKIHDNMRNWESGFTMRSVCLGYAAKYNLSIGFMARLSITYNFGE